MTDQMTPDEARALLDGTTPGPWEWRWETGALSVFDVEEEPVATDLDVRDSDLIAAAPVLAAMIAGMRAEYRHEVQSITDRTWQPLTEWAEGEPDRRPWDVAPTRIVRRYVTTEEEA